MAANFLHGIETIEKDDGARPIRVVKSSVVALIGTAATGPVNELTQCLSDRDAPQFGPDLPGFTIANAFKAIYKQGPATVLVVNVLDPEEHVGTAENEEQTFGVNNKLTLDNPSVIDFTKLALSGEVTEYTVDVDFTINKVTGEITRITDGDIPAKAVVKATYTYADPSLVAPSDIIGAVDMAGLRQGLKAFDDAYNLFGYWPKIFIAPGFSSVKAVSTELTSVSDRMGGQALIDAPIGVTVPQAMAGRGPEGMINFDTSSDRTILCYPHVKAYDAITDSEHLEPYSQYLAGVMVSKDLERGYWWSPSNTEIKGITGIERPLTARVDDPQSEVNALNEVGITTIFNSFGTGFRVWGNRTAAWPNVTHMKNFINVRRTKDVIDESIRYSSLQFVDRPVTQALIDAVVESVNQFIRKLIADDALLGGECWFDKARNPNTNLALGNVIFNYKLTVPVPMERGTFETEITDEYMVSLGGN